MSESYVNQFSVETVSVSSNTIPVFCLAFWVIEIFLFDVVLLNSGGRIYNFFSTCRSCIQSQVDLCDHDLKAEVLKDREFELTKNRSSCSGEKVEEDGRLSREDVEVVMTRLGGFCHPEGEKLQERFGFDDLSSLFEEKEPSLEEVKSAFDVFDENGDGFIDAKELQRVLSNLGFKDGLEMEKCRRMIGVFDDNSDGRIDFNEFVKFMENTFC